MTSVFGEDFQIVNITQGAGIIPNMQRFKDTDVGWSTNGYKVFKYLRENDIRVDRVFIFTDCQLWDDDENENYWGSGDRSIAEEYRKYRSEVGANPYVYIVDLAGYGTAQFSENEGRVVQIAGWSDKIFEFVKLFEADRKKAVMHIEVLGTGYFEKAKKPEKKKRKVKARKAKPKKNAKKKARKIRKRKRTKSRVH